MWRVSLACLLLATAAATADDEPHPQPRGDAHAAASADPREALAIQLADETGAIDRALATVSDKLATADQVRAKRLRAAYRMLRDARTDGESQMAFARRRAAARLLVDRDAAERGLLADEASRLRAAHVRTSADTDRVAVLQVPADLERPVAGKIAHKFGTLEHERSKATLARRGLDFEVDDHAPVSAPADGTVRFAGPIRGLEQGVIIDHGDYFTVIAKLGPPAVPVGALIHRGDRLGRAARHRVYFEVRMRIGPGGRPIDPEPLLAAPPAKH